MIKVSSMLRGAAAYLLAAAWLCACASEHMREEDSEQVNLGASERAAAGRWLHQLRQAHAAVDAAHTPHDIATALDRLTELAVQSAPNSIPPADAARMRRDLYARAAQLAVSQKRYEEADALIARGLQLEGSDPFRVQLLLVAVEVRRALGDTQGEAEAVARARGALEGRR